VCLLSSTAAAQGYAVDRFEPAERGSDWFASDSLDLRGRARPLAGVVTDWSYRPLVIRRDGEPERSVITDQVFVHPGAGLVFGDRFRAAFSLPVAVFQHGDERASPDRPAIGDVRLAADARLAGAYGDVARLGIGLQVFAPTGLRSRFTGDGTFRVAPRLLAAGDVSGFAWAAKIGFAFRPHDGRFEGRELGSEAIFSVSAGLKVNDRFIVGPEIYGATADLSSARASTLEGLLGTHIVLWDDWRFGNGIGTSLVGGDGAADLRVLVAFDYAPDVCVDKDNDGICAREDACPFAAGVRTNVRSTNGCPRVDEENRPPPKEPAPVKEPAEEPPKVEEPPLEEPSPTPE
jgi:OOP family OmpA-OmpF porin